MTRALMWFRTDLRVADNSALAAAAEAAGSVTAVFLLAPEQWREHGWGAPKADFVLRNVAALGQALGRLGIPLRIRRASRFSAAPRALLDIAAEEGCDALFYNREYEVDERARDGRVERAFAGRGIPVRAFDDQTVVPPDRPSTGAGGFYKVFTPYRRAWLARVQREGLPRPLAAPPRRGRAVRGDAVPEAVAGLGRPRHDAAPWPAGEAEAARRLDRFVETRVERYRAARDFPAEAGTSALSPYLACGVLSPRQCLAAAADANTGQIDAGSEGVVTWVSELIWREFYRHVLVGFPRVCKDRPFREETEALRWSSNDEHFERWREGRTGVPIVDAGMRELAGTGWMHNRVRMIVAMYLSKNLFIDWRRGERHFMERLVDADFASNNGGWQWSASTGCDAAPYFRIFNPVSQSERYDSAGRYIRRWCPELSALDDRAVHDPTRLDPDERRRLDYPEPLVDLGVSRLRAIAAFRRLGRPTG